MQTYIVTISAPRYLTADEEIVLGAKGLFDLMRVFLKYSKKYYNFSVKVR